MSVEQKLNEIFDKDRVMEQVDGDVELLMEMVELFTSGYPELLSNIKNAVTKKDSNLLGRSAHTLKGSVGNFAADSVYDTALSLEIMGRNNDMSHAEEAYIKLEKEIEKLMFAFDILKKGNCFMTILIAEDDIVTRKMLEDNLIKWGYDVIVTCDGSEAWQTLQRENAPKLAILDWIMPCMDGIELCRNIRNTASLQSLYIILVTIKGQKKDIIEGLHVGADDYITKPFDRDELRARIQAGVRIVELQANIADHVRELENALSNIRQLQELLPICCYCKKIRNDQNYWQQVEEYLSQHLEVEFSHGICPECYEKVVKLELEICYPSNEV